MMTGLTRRTRALALLVCMAGATAPAMAEMPKMSAERRIELRMATASLSADLFRLAYALQPHCPMEFQIQVDGGMYEFRSTSPGKDKYIQAQAAAMSKLFPQAGDGLVVIAVPAGGPSALAGLQVGDTLEPARTSPQPAPGAAAQGASAPSPSEDAPSARVNRLRSLLDHRLSSPAVNTVRVLRNGNVSDVRLRKFPVCRIVFVPVESQHAYAESAEREVFVTTALFDALDDAGRKSILALEVAQVALGKTVGRTTTKFVAAILMPQNLEMLGANAESGYRLAPEAELTHSDQLALHLALGLGVEPPAYLAALKIADALPGMNGRGFTNYSATRPLTPNRLKLLEAAVQQWTTTGQLPVPAGVSPDVLQQVNSRLHDAVHEPAKVFSPGS